MTAAGASSCAVPRPRASTRREGAGAAVHVTSPERERVPLCTMGRILTVMALACGLAVVSGCSGDDGPTGEAETTTSLVAPGGANQGGRGPSVDNVSTVVTPSSSAAPGVPGSTAEGAGTTSTSTQGAGPTSSTTRY